jgi:hypothetical protein
MPGSRCSLIGIIDEPDLTWRKQNNIPRRRIFRSGRMVGYSSITFSATLRVTSRLVVIRLEPRFLLEDSATFVLPKSYSRTL